MKILFKKAGGSNTKIVHSKHHSASNNHDHLYKTISQLINNKLKELDVQAQLDGTYISHQNRNSTGKVSKQDIISELRELLLSSNNIFSHLRTTLDLDKSIKTSLYSDFIKAQTSAQKFWKSYDNLLRLNPIELAIEGFESSWDFTSPSALNHYAVASNKVYKIKNLEYPKLLTDFYRKHSINKEVNITIFNTVTEENFTLSVEASVSGDSLIRQIFTKTIRKNSNSFESAITGNDVTKTSMNESVNNENNESTEEGKDEYKNYVLKAVGFKEYIYGNEPLYAFSYIQNYSYLNKQLKCYFFNKSNEKLKSELNTSNPFNSSHLKNYKQKHKDDIENLKKLVPRLNESPLITRLCNNQIIVQKLNLPITFRIESVNSLNNMEFFTPVNFISFKILLYYGETIIFSERTKTKVYSEITHFNEFINSCVKYSEIPRETRVAFILYGSKSEVKWRPLAYVCQQLIDEHGYLLRSRKTLKFWKLSKEESNPLFFLKSPTTENLRVTNEPKIELKLKFNSFLVNAKFDDSTELNIIPNINVVGPKVEWNNLHEKTKISVRNLINKDPLYSLTDSDKNLVWMTRHYLTGSNRALPILLSSLNWGSFEHRKEVYSLMLNWKVKLTPIQAMALLNMQFHDTKVRSFAVQNLKKLKDSLLQLYILQLVQCIKYESYHTSRLIRFLIKRAIKNPVYIGHALFWAIKTEMEYQPEYQERYSLMLEEFFVNCSNYSNIIHKQIITINKLKKIALKVKRARTDLKESNVYCKTLFKEELTKLNEEWLSQINSFQNPVNPFVFLGTVVVDKCKFFSSKMVPLLLFFKNDDPLGEDYSFIFKCGDDLRQDALTLQLMRFMDRIWTSAGYDMKLTPYNVIALGAGEDGSGMGILQTITNAETTSQVQIGFGGSLIGALKINTIHKFIQKHNPDDTDTAVENFVYSCAAYCVATCIMGIGDRHNGNIMITYNGHLFHIDFGHFLGNFKFKYGIKRERAAFVFLPEMAYAMGGSNFTKSNNFILFQSLCTKVFNKLRYQGNSLITLFDLMVGASMPELTKRQDIEYLKDKLCLDMNETEAGKIFVNELHTSLSATSRKIDNLIHNLKHG